MAKYNYSDSYLLSGLSLKNGAVAYSKLFRQNKPIGSLVTIYEPPVLQVLEWSIDYLPPKPGETVPDGMPGVPFDPVPSRYAEIIPAYVYCDYDALVSALEIHAAGVQGAENYMPPRADKREIDIYDHYIRTYHPFHLIGACHRLGRDTVGYIIQDLIERGFPIPNPRTRLDKIKQILKDPYALRTPKDSSWLI